MFLYVLTIIILLSCSLLVNTIPFFSRTAIQIIASQLRRRGACIVENVVRTQHKNMMNKLDRKGVITVDVEEELAYRFICSHFACIYTQLVHIPLCFLSLIKYYIITYNCNQHLYYSPILHNCSFVIINRLLYLVWSVDLVNSNALHLFLKYTHTHAHTLLMIDSVICPRPLMVLRFSAHQYHHHHNSVDLTIR